MSINSPLWLPVLTWVKHNARLGPAVSVLKSFPDQSACTVQQLLALRHLSAMCQQSGGAAALDCPAAACRLLCPATWSRCMLANSFSKLLQERRKMEADAAAAGKPVKHPLRPRSEYMDQVSQHRVNTAAASRKAATQALYLRP